MTLAITVCKHLWWNLERSHSFDHRMTAHHHSIKCSYPRTRINLTFLLYLLVMSWKIFTTSCSFYCLWSYYKWDLYFLFLNLLIDRERKYWYFYLILLNGKYLNILYGAMNECYILLGATWWMLYVMGCSVVDVIYYGVRCDECYILWGAMWWMWYIIGCNIMDVLYYGVQCDVIYYGVILYGNNVPWLNWSN